MTELDELIVDHEEFTIEGGKDFFARQFADALVGKLYTTINDDKFSDSLDDEYVCQRISEAYKAMKGEK